jgi:multicomponent Na+:H+ antiporter subunit E
MEFFAFWAVLFGLNFRALIVGILAALITTSVSLRLLPTGQWRLQPIALMHLIFQFLQQSISAGVDVAWRALDPRLPLRPGFVIYRTGIPPGLTRNMFCTITSLLPGTLPCGTDANGDLIVHCLDTSQPVTEGLAAQEASLLRAVGRRHYRG